MTVTSPIILHLGKWFVNCTNRVAAHFIKPLFVLISDGSNDPSDKKEVIVTARDCLEKYCSSSNDNFTFLSRSKQVKVA